MSEVVFKRRMLMMFIKDIKRIENDNSPINIYDYTYYANTLFFKAFLVRMLFCVLLRAAFKPLRKYMQ